jgi:putative flippase GtrA
MTGPGGGAALAREADRYRRSRRAGALWLALQYAIFAVVSIMANVAAQAAAHWIYRGAGELYASLAAGTLAGLALKYVLDKKYIFESSTLGAVAEGKRFTRYAGTGVATTLIFWGCEIFFDQVFQTLSMRYAGAVIGLTAGYCLKYRLDKRFVFATGPRVP